ncbi:MAG: hypothetical protein K5829_02920 [Treponema sp.]|nr:hypothetical protein [Treponema sp.]
MKRIFLSLFIILLFVSCEYGIPYVEFDKASYNAAKEKWESLGWTDYTFTYQICSVATGPNYPKVIMTVTPEGSSYELSGDEEALSVFDENAAKFENAESFFNSIQEEYTSACQYVAKRPKGLVSYNIDVEYDSESGFPSYISYAGAWSEEYSVDGDWYSIKITNIQSIEQ